MSADDAIEINFPSLARSAPDENLVEPTKSEAAPAEESDDFAWLAAAFADEDLVLDDEEQFGNEDTADGVLTAVAPSEPPPAASVLLPDEADDQPTVADDVVDDVVDDVADDAVANDGARPTMTSLDALSDALGSVPPLITRSAKPDEEDPFTAPPEIEPAAGDSASEPGKALLEELMSEQASVGDRAAGISAEQPEDVTSETTLDSTTSDSTTSDLTGPDLTGPDLTGPDLTGPEQAAPDENADEGRPDAKEASEDLQEKIDTLRRRPGFREELLSAFSQIYKR